MSTIFDAIGQTPGCRAIATNFYERVDTNEILRPLFPGKSLHCATEELAAFLVEFLDKPGPDSQRRWRVSLRESHAKFHIDQEQRAEWLRLMTETLSEVVADVSARQTLMDFFTGSSAYITGDNKAKVDLEGRWPVQLKLEQAIAAIRRLDAARAIELAGEIPLERRTGLVAEMIRSKDPWLLEYAAEIAPSLKSEFHASRTLLNVAAMTGSVSLVDILLKAGADPRAGIHTPLYDAANGAGTKAIVRSLVNAGVDINAPEGSNSCTPLHMAARRGNIAVAEALLDCGADINPRDVSGDTPLRRALNCRKSSVARLLEERGGVPS